MVPKVIYVKTQGSERAIGLSMKIWCVFKDLVCMIKICGLRIFFVYLGKLFLNYRIIIKNKNLVSADLAMAGLDIISRVSNRSIKLDGRYFGGVREIYLRGVYFLPAGFEINHNDTAVDLGANVGVFSMIAATLGKKVIAVEAQSGVLDEIRLNAKKNDLMDKISIEFGMIGSESGLFSDYNGLESASHYGKKPPILSMNKILSRHNLKVIDFLKIDIEGSEFDLLNRDTAWLSTVKKIAMEVHPEFGKVENLKTKLESEGFFVSIFSLECKRVDETNRGFDGNCFVFAKRK
ncbi:MAG: FkbM family methyltransferase [Nitrospinaceae bacterium]|nr:FkbM family methyltransferase [Nitrospinaceae bacterium]MBT5368196.1 FkbM family methyltransferase [Nitrospinaceae bacterium]MBT6395771.1 FkbM family methyltransferase [Nitrospinaceae bacterium]